MRGMLGPPVHCPPSNLPFSHSRSLSCLLASVSFSGRIFGLSDGLPAADLADGGGVGAKQRGSLAQFIHSRAENYTVHGASEVST